MIEDGQTSCRFRKQVWDIATLECVDTLKGHTGPVRTLVYSGGRMFSGSYDKTVRVWDVTTLKCLATLQGAASMTCNCWFLLHLKAMMRRSTICNVDGPSLLMVSSALERLNIRVCA